MGHTYFSRSTVVILAVIAIVALSQQKSLAVSQSNNQFVTITDNESPILNATSSISKVTSDENAVANFNIPDGYFHFGFTDSCIILTSRFLLGPAFTQATWKNACTDNYTDFIWHYPDESLTSWATSSSKDLVTPPYKPSTILAPWLVAKSATLTDTISPFYSVKYGGIAETPALVFSAGNFDICMPKRRSARAFSTSSDADLNVWKPIFTTATFTPDSCHVTAFTEYFPATPHPFQMSTVKILVYAPKFTTPLPVQLVIRKATLGTDGLPVFGDTVATSVLTESNLVRKGTSKNAVFIFPLKAKSESGLEKEADLNVDYSFAITINAPRNGDKFTFYPYFPGDYNTPSAYPNTAFVNIDIFKGGTASDTMVSTVKAPLGNAAPYIYCTGFCFEIDASYNWLHCTDNSFNAPAEGGSKEFMIGSNKASTDEFTNQSYWKISQADGSALPSWITTIAADSTVTDSLKITNYAKATKFTVFADANTSGKARSCDVKITYPGAGDLVLNVTQGFSGVNRIRANSGINVSVSGNDFIIRHPAEVNAVKIYDAAGMMVGQSALSGVSSIVSASAIPHGLYIFRFNDGVSVKVVR
jgi:hypothetical protein